MSSEVQYGSLDFWPTSSELQKKDIDSLENNKDSFVEEIEKNPKVTEIVNNLNDWPDSGGTLDFWSSESSNTITEKTDVDFSKLSISEIKKAIREWSITADTVVDIAREKDLNIHNDQISEMVKYIKLPGGGNKRIMFSRTIQNIFKG